MILLSVINLQTKQEEINPKPKEHDAVRSTLNKQKDQVLHLF